jgi:hypothetical protein
MDLMRTDHEEEQRRSALLKKQIEEIEKSRMGGFADLPFDVKVMITVWVYLVLVLLLS